MPRDLLYLLLLLSYFSRVRLCDPIDGSPSGSSVPGILQARTLEWVANLLMVVINAVLTARNHSKKEGNATIYTSHHSCMMLFWLLMRNITEKVQQLFFRGETES